MITSSRQPYAERLPHRLHRATA